MKLPDVNGHRNKTPLDKQLRFRDLAIGARFKFTWSGYTGIKQSARTYTLVQDIKPHRYTVGSINVEVEEVKQ
jgi:hypothetical protein